MHLFPHSPRRLPVPPLREQIGGQGPEPERCPRDVGGLVQDFRGFVGVVQVQEVEEPQILAQPPDGGEGFCPALQHGDPLLRVARPHRGGLGQEDGAVVVRDLQPVIEGGRDVDERVEQVEALPTLEDVLTAKILHGPQPVDVGREGLESRKEAAHLLARPQVQDFFLGAESTGEEVEPTLGQRDRGQEGENEIQAQLQKSRDRKTLRPRPSTRPM